MIHAGQKLKDERVKKKLTLEQVEKATKIKSSFIESIEKGEYNKLPSSTYAYGFISNYAEYLGLPKSRIVALFKREFDEEKIYRVLPEGFSKNTDFPIKRIKIKEVSFLIAFIFLILVGYIAYQYRYAIISPDLKIYTPKEGEIVNSKEITVSGQTDSNAAVYIDNASVSTNQDGIFKKNINLFPGKRIIKIKAINRFGKETDLERQIEMKE